MPPGSLPARIQMRPPTCPRRLPADLHRPTARRHRRPPRAHNTLARPAHNALKAVWICRGANVAGGARLAARGRLDRHGFRDGNRQSTSLRAIARRWVEGYTQTLDPPMSRSGRNARRRDHQPAGDSPAGRTHRTTATASWSSSTTRPGVGADRRPTRGPRQARRSTSWRAPYAAPAVPPGRAAPLAGARCGRGSTATRA